MISIKRLKEPKKGKSGKELKPGQSTELAGIMIKNNNHRYSVFVSQYKRIGQDFVLRKKRSKESTKGVRDVKTGK